MRGAAIALAVVVLSCVAATDAAAGETCVSIKKKTKLYATASLETPVGAATKKVVGFVEDTGGGWHLVRFERLEVQKTSGSDEEHHVRDAQVRVHVRKRDARKARCPRGPNLFLIMPAGAGVDFYWPDGTAAGWVKGLPSGTLRASTGEVVAGDRTLRCIRYTGLRGLKLRVCGDPADQDDGVDSVDPRPQR